MNVFDIDGVIYMGPGHGIGVRPGPTDIIITGRSLEETEYTLKMLREADIHNHVVFNNVKFKDKTRESSGEHKARTIRQLLDDGLDVDLVFEDDEIQAEVIQRECPEVNVVMVISHNLVEKENVWHGEDDSNPL